MNARVVPVCFAALVLAGCVRYTKSVHYDDAPTAEAAYLYGRFELRSSREEWWRMGGHVRMGFRVECSSKEFYTIRFMVTAPLQLIEIAPASCSMTEIVFTTAGDEVVARKPLPPELMQNERFEAGKAYYIGDFYGTTDESSVQTMWKVDEVRNEYESTTRILKSWFPRFAGMSTEDRMRRPADDADVMPPAGVNPFSM
jgi:hypothetical protein